MQMQFWTFTMYLYLPKLIFNQIWNDFSLWFRKVLINFICKLTTSRIITKLVYKCWKFLESRNKIFQVFEKDTGKETCEGLFKAI